MNKLRVDVRTIGLNLTLLECASDFAGACDCATVRLK